jgi:hypothetical protein
VRILAPLILFGCSSASAEAPAAACDGAEVLVAASDYRTSLVCAAPACEANATHGLDLGSDPMLVAAGGRAFFLARDYDLVFEIDPTCGRPSKPINLRAFAPRDPSTGETAPANPHDVAVAPDGTLVIALYGAAKLAFVHGEAPIETVDLAPFDEADGNPQADALRIVDVDGVSKAFVALERLDDKDKLVSTRPSQMLRIDVRSRSVEAVVELAGRNPFNPMSEHDGALFLAEPGAFDGATDPRAGIERFDTRTSTTRLLVQESALGGSVVEVAVSAACGVAIVAGPEKDVNPTSLVAFDPSSGAVLGTLLGPTPGYDLQGLAWRSRTLYVGDRRRGPNGYPVHVFDDACALRPASRTIDLPQRPVALRATSLPLPASTRGPR